MIIAIAGRARSGKDTAAQVLVSEGFSVIRFADPLKDMLRALLASAGYIPDQIESHIEGDQKLRSIPELCDVTARFLMQRLGGEWGRDTIHKDLWVRLALTRAAKYRDTVIPDCRHFNEADAIRNAGGTVIRVTRPGIVKLDHQSENFIDSLNVDFEIVNDGTLDDLQQKVLKIVSRL
jgi:hypothetical protein